MAAGDLQLREGVHRRSERSRRCGSGAWGSQEESSTLPTRSFTGQGGANPLYPVGHWCPRSPHRGHQGLHDRMGEEKCVFGCWSHRGLEAWGGDGGPRSASWAPSEQVLGKAGAGAELTSLSSQPLFSSSHTCEEASGSRRLVDSG